MDKQRTLRQNNALHLYFTELAHELNTAGLDVKKALPNFKVDVPWSPMTIKELIWKPIQEAQLLKKSTTKLTSAEVSKVYDTVNRFVAELGLSVPFPSWELMIEDYEQIGNQKT